MEKTGKNIGTLRNHTFNPASAARKVNYHLDGCGSLPDHYIQGIVKALLYSSKVGKSPEERVER